jgi:hypothetical protein
VKAHLRIPELGSVDGPPTRRAPNIGGGLSARFSLALTKFWPIELGLLKISEVAKIADIVGPISVGWKSSCSPSSSILCEK